MQVVALEQQAERVLQRHGAEVAELRRGFEVSPRLGLRWHAHNAAGVLHRRKGPPLGAPVKEGGSAARQMRVCVLLA